MTVCPRCGDVLVEVLPDGFLCPDCFFEEFGRFMRSKYVPWSGAGRESGTTASGTGNGNPETRGTTERPAAKFLCPSCHAWKPYMGPVDYILSTGSDGKVTVYKWWVCSSCYTYRLEHAERADAREDEMRGYVG